MDPLINKLNQQVAEKIKNQNTPTLKNDGQPSPFEMVLQDKRFEQQQSSLSTLLNDFKEKEPDIKAISAQNIRLDKVEGDTNIQNDFDPKKKLYSMFESINSDMLSLDSTIEVLSNPNISLSKRQLLAFQAGVGNMTIQTELFTRTIQITAQNMMEFFRMQMS